MNLAYVDSSVWITRVEGLNSYKIFIDRCLQNLSEEDWMFCISDAVILEVLLKPYKQNQVALLNIYNRLF